MSDFKIKTEAQGLEKFEEETAVNKRLHYDATVKKLLDMKLYFQQEVALRLPNDISLASLESTFGTYPTSISAVPLESL